MRKQYVFVCLLLAALHGLAPASCLACANLETSLRHRVERQFDGLRPEKWGITLAGVRSHLQVQDKGRFVLALTLDACGGRKNGYDAELIAWLRAQGIPATLFVTTVWMREYSDIFKDLAGDPLFEIAAHGERHKPASVNGRSAYGISGTRSVAELIQEVEGNAEAIRSATGERPRWFRSGTAFYDDVAVRVIQALGLAIAGYSISGDDGARLSAQGVEKRLLAATSGDIILCHMNRPESGTREGLKAALPKLLARGVHFVRLSDAGAD